MKTVVWGFFGLLAALWSLGAWALHRLAGAGPAAVTTISRWLEIDPSRTQWIGDGLAAAGWLAQALVVLFWLMGLGLIAMFAWMSNRAAKGMTELGEEVARQRDGLGGGRAQVIEGEAVVVRREPTARLPREPQPGRDPPAG